MVTFEKTSGLMDGFRSFLRDMNIANVSTGVLGGFIIGLVAIPLVLKAGESANLSKEVVESWLFSIYFFGAMVGIILALMYKKPIVGAWSIPGIFAIASVLKAFTFNEAVGAFLVSGILVLFLGITGWIKKLIALIPLPIMMAMVAGVLFKWAMGMIGAFQKAPLLCLVGIVGYGLSRLVFKKVPPVLGTFVFGIIAAAFMGQLNLQGIEIGFARPMFFKPVFTIQSIVSIGIPLALLVVAAENMQAIGVLTSQKYDPPINAMTIMSGLGGLVAPWFGGHNANIAGPMTAFCSAPDAGEPEKRYVAAVWNGILFGALGLFAPLSLSMIHLLPKAIISLLVGLVLMNIIIGALNEAFGSKRFVLGAFTSFVIAMADVTMFQIGGAFWALVLGSVVSYLLERPSFKMELVEETVRL